MSIKRTIQPERIYFSVGEVVAMLGVTPSWVHYWSGKLGLPVRASKGQHRRLKRDEIDALMEIRKMKN